MTIIDARWETPQEKQKRETFHKSFDRKQESIKWCNENVERLIKWHSEFSIEYPDKLKDRELQRREDRAIQIQENNRVFEEIKSGVEHFCPCGGKIRYIQSFNFCGCENYKNKLIYHKTYNLMEYDPETPLNIEIGKMYLTEFKKKYRISAMTSIIYKTLKANGVELLCHIEDDYFQVARNASLDSSTEEAIIMETLNSKFSKVYHQQGMVLFDGKKYFTRIPDYICIGDQFIYVIDAKKALRNIDERQLQEYHDGVQLIGRKAGMRQQVISFFILFDYEGLTNNQLKEANCYNIQMLHGL